MASTGQPLFDLFSGAAQVFVAGLWQGCILIAAVALCLRLLPGITAGMRFAIWLLTFTLVAALPLLPLGVQSYRRAVPVAMAHAELHAGRQWAIAIALAWALLMMVRAAELLIQVLRLHKVWRRADPIAVDGDLLALLGTSARPAVLCLSSDVDSPGMIGFFRPRLLIPRALYSTLKPEQLRQILLHECAHLRRNDDWINLLQKAALVLFPLNLALVWIDGRLGSERELACDASVVASTEAPLQYARCLTELAEHRLASRRLALLLPAWSRQPELSRRVRTLLHPSRVLSPRWSSAAGLLVCLCLAGTVSVLGHLPRLVSFESAPVDESIPQGRLEAQALKPAFSAVSTGQAQPFVTAGTGLMRAQLVSAIMPSRSPIAVEGAKSDLRKLRSPLRLAPRAGSRVVSSSRFSATRAQQAYSERQSPSLPLTRLTQISISYAAVPFGDGWLIVQL